jgi:DNA-binding protein HU-beta
MTIRRCSVTKTELVSAVADSAGLTKSAAEMVVKCIVDEITGCLQKGDKLTLVGFGTFDTTTRAARKGQNPRTGKKISIAETVSPKFKAGKALKDAVSK